MGPSYSSVLYSEVTHESISTGQVSYEQWCSLVGVTFIRDSYSDIDECAEMRDNCNRVGPTPAECINTEGGYECSCSQYTGYRVSADGITCEGKVPFS